MRFFIRLMREIHKILGTLLSVFFLMWFISGIVMIYKRFPNVNRVIHRYQTSLPDTLPDLQLLSGVLPDSVSIRSLSVEVEREQPLFNIVTDKGRFKLSADTLLQEVEHPQVTYAEIESYAKRWAGGHIERVDTLRQLEQWIPMSSFRSHFPIYKFVYNDLDKSYLYVSSTTGKALQYVTRSDRFWAWVGPIPHFLYFWQLRQDAKLWSSVVSWISGLGAIMCLAGGVMGIYSYVVVWQRRRRFRSPYKKWDFKWHHIIGFFFGFFVFMFILSGFMSLNSLPKWFMKNEDTDLSERLFDEAPLVLGDLRGDYRAILSAYPGDVKSIALKRYEDRQFYNVQTSEKEVALEVVGGEVVPLSLTQAEVGQKMDRVLRHPYTMVLMTEPDNYYGGSRRTPLPAYKVEVQDKDHTTLYISTETGRTRSYTARSKVERWIYPAFHTFKIKPFVSHPVAREVFLWILLLAGVVVSFTGVVLGIKYIKRLFTPKKKKRRPRA